MGIDYVIDLDCVPKQTLSTMGILTRLKARERANRIIKLYRDNGDMRVPAEMGFEMARRTPDGAEEVQVVIVQSLLDEAAPLDPLAHYCTDCPVNFRDRPFGCFSNIGYPISKAAEMWLLKALPLAEEPLPFLLLREIISDNRALAAQAGEIRAGSSAIFETQDVFGRMVEGITATTNHLFGLLFLQGTVNPVHGVMLLLFFRAIRRDMEADELRSLTPAPLDYPDRYPLLIVDDATDDPRITEIKDYLTALYTAWGLNLTVSLDV